MISFCRLGAVILKIHNFFLSVHAEFGRAHSPMEDSAVTWPMHFFYLPCRRLPFEPASMRHDLAGSVSQATVYKRPDQKSKTMKESFASISTGQLTSSWLFCYPSWQQHYNTCTSTKFKMSAPTHMRSYLWTCDWSPSSIFKQKRIYVHFLNPSGGSLSKAKQQFYNCSNIS